MPRVTPFLAGAAAAATLIAGSLVASAAQAETSAEPIAPMTTFDPELPRELGSGDLRRVFSYSCVVEGGGLRVEADAVRVEVESTIPKEVDPGDVIAEQPFDVEVTLPDSAYDEVSRLGATHQEWTMPVGLSMRAGYEAPADLEPFDVAVPREPLIGVPWRLSMRGTLPPIAVPNLAHTPGGEWYQHELWLDMPERLSIRGALQTPEGEVPATVTCDGPQDLTLGGTWVTTWPRPTDGTAPTETPTTPPPSDPGTEPGGPIDVGPGTLSRTVTYQCAVVAGGLYLGIQDFRLAASADYPEAAQPGGVLAERPVSLSWTANELLRNATTTLLGTREASAETAGAAFSITTSDRTTEVEPAGLSFPRSGVPQTANTPWTMEGTGMIPAIEVPQDATGAVWLGLPARLQLEIPMYKADNSTIPTTADCSASRDRLLGGIALSAQTAPTPPVLDPVDPPSEPTAPPTSDPTDPTDPPTSDPTDPGPTVPLPEPGGPVDVGPGTLSRTVAYQCAVVAGGLDLGFQDFRLGATADYPETAEPGGVLSERAISVRWTASDLMREITALLLGAREARATTAGAALSVTTSGRSAELEPTTLSFPRSGVSQTRSTPWVLEGTGTIPSITVPQDATGAVWLGLPARMQIEFTLYAQDDSTIPMTANCSAGRDRLLGAIALSGQTAPTPPVLDPVDPPTQPTQPTPPTDPPTSDPTDPPTEPGGEPSVGPGEVSRVLPHRCEVVAGGLDLGIQDATVTVSTDLPGSAWPGEVLAPRPLRVSIALPELLRQSTTLLLGAREVEGDATGTSLTLTSADRTTALPGASTRFPRAAIPQDGGEPWTIAGEGEIPAFAVPDDATEVLWLGMPATLRVDVTLHKADNSTIPTTLSCTGSQDRRFGGITLTDRPTDGPTTEPTSGPTTEPTSEPTSEPTTEPTSEPTTEPTSEPTTEPTSEPTTSPTVVPTTDATVEPTTQPTAPAQLDPTVKAGALGLFRSAVFTVGVSAKGVIPTGTVVVRRGDKVVAKGRLFLGITVLTAGGLPRGEHTFTVTYEGDGKVAAKTVTRKVRIL